MPDDREPVEGSYQDRENKRNEHAAVQGRLKTVRRALMATGGGLLALVLAKGALSGPLQPGIPEQSPNRPAAAETLNPEVYSRLLEQHPDAQVHLGGKLTLRLNQSRNEIFPHIRTSTVVENRTEPNILAGALQYPRINDVEFNFNPEGTDLEIENYATVPGDNTEESSPIAPKQDWLVLTFSGNDGNSVFGYINISRNTSSYFTFENRGDITSLGSLSDTGELSKINKTTQQP